MNRLGTMLSQMLVGTLVDGSDPHSLCDAMVSAGRQPEDVVVLAGRAGLDELLGHDRENGFLGQPAHLVRHIEALDSDGTGHVRYLGRWTVADHGHVPAVPIQGH